MNPEPPYNPSKADGAAAFYHSRSKELIDAEAARGGPQPVAAFALLYTHFTEAGMDPTVFAPTGLQAVILATGEKRETFAAIMRWLGAMQADLDDIKAGRL